MNVDAWEGPGVHPDVVADIRSLPFDDNSARAVYCGHVLEHLSWDVDLPLALSEVARVLVPGGRACFVGPDCSRALTNPEWKPLLPGIRYGGNRWPGDRHLWRSTGPKTLEALRPWFPDAVEVGVEHVADFWPLLDDPAWQFAIEATR